jgi:hypothetical protein
MNRLVDDFILLSECRKRDRVDDVDDDDNNDDDNSNNNNDDDNDMNRSKRIALPSFDENDSVLLCTVINTTEGSSTGQDRCIHNRDKYQCKDCGDSAICEHKRIKSICKDCRGRRICEHKRNKYT